MKPIKHRTHHPQHQTTVTHDQVFRIICDHGPVTHRDIIRYAGKLVHNLPKEIWKNAYKPPVVTLPSGATEPIFFAPMEEKISGYLRALSRSGSIQRVDGPKGNRRRYLWTARLTVADAITHLDDAGFAYVIVQKVYTRASKGLDSAFVKRIGAEIRAELKKNSKKEEGSG